MIIANRGDTIIANIVIKDKTTGEIYVPEATDTLRFALKKDYSDRKVLIYKEIPIDTMQLRIESEDTKKLDQPGMYYYDIQLTYGDGIVDTVIPNAKLKIVEEVE